MGKKLHFDYEKVKKKNVICNYCEFPEKWDSLPWPSEKPDINLVRASFSGIGGKKDPKCSERHRMAVIPKIVNGI